MSKKGTGVTQGTCLAASKDTPGHAKPRQSWKGEVEVFAWGEATREPNLSKQICPLPARTLPKYEGSLKISLPFVVVMTTIQKRRLHSLISEWTIWILWTACIVWGYWKGAL